MVQQSGQQFLQRPAQANLARQRQADEQGGKRTSGKDKNRGIQRVRSFCTRSKKGGNDAESVQFWRRREFGEKTAAGKS
jgi:hypothetical protein